MQKRRRRYIATSTLPLSHSNYAYNLFTFSVILFSGSDSVTGSSDGISNVRKSHVNATSNLFNKLKMYLKQKRK